MGGRHRHQGPEAPDFQEKLKSAQTVADLVELAKNEAVELTDEVKVLIGGKEWYEPKGDGCQMWGSPMRALWEVSHKSRGVLFARTVLGSREFSMRLYLVSCYDGHGQVGKDFACAVWACGSLRLPSI